MTHKDNYSIYHRGCSIKCQTTKKKPHEDNFAWIEGQVTMADKSFLYVQAEKTKIALLRAARRKIDDVLDAGDIWRRWATGEMECMPLPLPHNEYV